MVGHYSAAQCPKSRGYLAKCSNNGLNRERNRYAQVLRYRIDPLDEGLQLLATDHRHRRATSAGWGPKNVGCFPGWWSHSVRVVG
jgi:hypothetical protein